MSTEVAVQQESLTAAAVKDQVNLIQEVMNKVMINGVHYGTIPGCGDKPALLKAGAEKLASTFRLAIDPQVEDLSTDQCCRFRVRAVVTHQVTGIFLGAGIGEASGDEAKYAWRGSVCIEEFNATPESYRRQKWSRGAGGKAYAAPQVRTNQADVANTVLKMAKKRALVDAVLTVTAASDCFSQDIEDVPEEMREQPPQQSAVQPSVTPAESPLISDHQRKRAYAIGQESGLSIEQYRAIIRKHGFARDNEITSGPKYDAIIAELQNAKKGSGDHAKTDA